jgi:hypothetical protein
MFDYIEEMVKHEKVMFDYIEEMVKHEKEECAKVPEEMKFKAAKELRKEFFVQGILNTLKEMLDKDPSRWWFSIYHLTLGMGIRNWLRDKGFGEKELGIENLDYIYVELMERAILGKERDYSNEKTE